jgi:hypothetical protein
MNDPYFAATCFRVHIFVMFEQTCLVTRYTVLYIGAKPTHILYFTVVIHSFLGSSPHFSLSAVEKLSLPQKANPLCNHNIVKTAGHCQRFKF